MITTAKELDSIDKKIIAKVSEGLTAKEIGRDLNLSKHTISARIREMKRYYKCSSTIQLVQKVSVICGAVQGMGDKC